MKPLNLNKITPFFREMEKMLNDSNLSSTIKDRVQKTIDNYLDIAKNLQAISKEPDDNRRNALINKITKGGAEGGFSVGRSGSEALKVLNERVNLLVSAFSQAKASSETNSLFECFSKGDPCLSGRTSSLINWLAKHQGFDIDSMPDPEKTLYLPAIALSDLFFDYVDALPEEKSIHSMDFKQFLKRPANKKLAIEALKRYSKKDEKSAFEEALLLEGILSEGQTIKNWGKILDQILENKHQKLFSLIFNQIKVQNEGLY